MFLDLAKNKKSLIKEKHKRAKRYLPLYIMVIPVAIYFLIIKYIPMFGFVIAFFDYNIFDGIAGSPFIGFEAFKAVFTSLSFGMALMNTLIINMVKLAILMPLAIIFAILLNEVRVKLIKKYLQTVTFIPYFLSWAVIGIFTFNIFSYDYGYLNKIIEFLGGDPKAWYSTLGIWKSVLSITYVWKNLGWTAVFYVAAISSISSELYEAAEIDGATRLQKMLYITLPSLSSMICLTVSVNLSFLLLSDFEQVYSIIGEKWLLVPETEVLSTFIFRTGTGQTTIKSGQAFSTALSLVSAMVSLILFLFSNKIIKVMTKNDQMTLI